MFLSTFVMYLFDLLTFLNATLWNFDVRALASKFHSVAFRNVRRSNRYITRVDRNINGFLDGMDGTE